jgi:predicted HicB family RNase H-like nuclease
MSTDIIDQIIHKLPGESENGEAADTRVMTVRMPTTLHAALKEEARARKTSANKLAVAKLSIKAAILDKVAAEEAKTP